MDALDSKITKDVDFIKSLFPEEKVVKKMNIIFRAS